MPHDDHDEDEFMDVFVLSGDREKKSAHDTGYIAILAHDFAYSVRSRIQVT